MKQQMLTLLCIGFCVNISVAGCLPAPVPGEDVKLLDRSGTVRLVTQDNVDSLGQGASKNPCESGMMAVPRI
jgi:hypothetical protein